MTFSNILNTYTGGYYYISIDLTSIQDNILFILFIILSCI